VDEEEDVAPKVVRVPQVGLDAVHLLAWLVGVGVVACKVARCGVPVDLCEQPVSPGGQQLLIVVIVGKVAAGADIQLVFKELMHARKGAQARQAKQQFVVQQRRALH
jgi:hypothetical protein